MTQTKSFTLPAGVYYVGDPSYVLKKDDYEKLLNNDTLGIKTTGLTELNGRKLFILGDGPGDGIYEIRDGVEYDEDEEPLSLHIPVDAGWWGVIPVELLLDHETSEDDLYKYGMVIDSSDTEDGNGPLKEFDVDVTYKNGFDDFPSYAEFLFYTLTIFEDDK